MSDRRFELVDERLQQFLGQYGRLEHALRIEPSDLVSRLQFRGRGG